MKNFRCVAFASLLAVALMSGCDKPKTADSTPNASNLNAASPATTSTPDATPIETPQEEQKELFKPAAGTGNIQGKVLFNDKPAANILVTLSEKFSTIFGASGKSFTARTDKNGVFVLKNIPPKEYEGLTARVFDSPMVVFMQSGILSAKKYSVEADKTLFVDNTNLFKNDLKVINPKASSSNAGTLVFQWQPYPAATYYKISLYADNFKSGVNTYDQRVDGTTFTPEKPLEKGGYRVQIAAFNANDHKLAECADQYKFRVK